MKFLEKLNKTQKIVIGGVVGVVLVAGALLWHEASSPKSAPPTPVAEVVAPAPQVATFPTKKIADAACRPNGSYQISATTYACNVQVAKAEPVKVVGEPPK